MDCDGTAFIYDPGRGKPLSQRSAVFPLLAQQHRHLHTAEHLRYMVNHTIFAPEQGYLLTMAVDGKSLVHQALTMKELVADAGETFLVVTGAAPNAEAGRVWRHKVRVLASSDALTYKLVTAPTGARLGDDGVVTWSVPRKIKTEFERVVIEIRSGDGLVAYDTSDLRLSADPELQKKAK
jgi:hypothetical protein